MSSKPKRKNLKSAPDDAVDPLPEVEELEELKQMMEGLEADMEHLEGALQKIDSDSIELKEEDQEDEQDPKDEIALEDKDNATRTIATAPLPRSAPSGLRRELDQEKKVEDSAKRLKISVERDHSLPPRSETVFGYQPSVDAEASTKPKKKSTKPPKPSKRLRKQEKRLDRAKKLTAKADKDAEQAIESPQRPVGAEDELDSGLRFDDLDMENPLPEAAYAPGKDHTGLVLDRRQRRVEAAIRSEMQGPDEADWEQEELTDAENLSPDRKFNLPVYLAKAVLVTLAGSLVVLGIQIALKGFRDADLGEEMKARETTPGLTAIGLEEAKTVMRSFLRAPNWQTKLKFVRNPDMAKARMEGFYRSHSDGALGFKELVDQQYNALDDGEGHLFTCELTDGRTIDIPVVRFPEEAPFYVVDWEAFVDYSDQNWSEFIAQRKPGSRGIFRVYAAEDDFYAWQFADPERFLGMQVYDTDKTEIAYAYVAIGTVDSREIRANLLLWKNRHEASRPSYVKDLPPWIPKPPDWAPMVIELQFPETVQGAVPQLEVVRFISSNWVLTYNE